jgi:hypothetical protein
MILRYFLLTFLLIRIILISGCSSLRNANDKFFTLKNAYYQSWMINNNDKGTNIYIELTDVKPGVEFDSVVFRGIKIPVFIDEKDSITKLKSILYRDLDIFFKNQKVSNLPDQLIYHYHNSKYSFKLDTIRRINMRYY